MSAPARYSYCMLPINQPLAPIILYLQVLASASVVHFDLKAANVLIQPNEGVTDGTLWGPPPPPPCEPPFRAVLADFGEARAYRSAEEAFTARNRCVA
jgi:serine/threonine protein kinase